MINVAVVGHGQSMVGSEWGQTIDSHTHVVRLKGSSLVIGTPDFGKRTSALCASTEIMGTFFKSKADEYWAYPKNGKFDGDVALKVITQLQKPVMIPLRLCNDWNDQFRKMGAMHNNVSTGMAAIIMALDRYNPDEVKLFGFDTLLDPKKEFLRHPDIPRSGVGHIDHDWHMENKLLGQLRFVYSAVIE